MFIFCNVNIVPPYTRIAIITSFYDSLAFTMFAPIIIIIVVVVSIIILTYVQYSGMYNQAYEHIYLRAAINGKRL